MAIKLTFNTRIRDGIHLLLDDKVDPIIDFDGTRYLINITKWGEGLIIWSEFDITTQQVIGEHAYRYRFAAHNTFKDCIFGPSSRTSTQELPTTIFPAFPTPRDYGTVTP